MHEEPITPAGLARLTAELERLVDRYGSGELVREDEDLLAARIGLLEQRLAAARVCPPDPNGVAEIGERVRVWDLDTGRRLELELVGPYEADPLAGRVSTVSPIGRALLGCRRGDVAVVDAPGGTRRLEVIALDEEMQPSGAADAARTPWRRTPARSTLGRTSRRR